MHGDVVDDEVSLDEGLFLRLFDDWWTVQVHLVVHYQERVVRIKHIIIDRHTIKILLQQILEKEVFLLKRCFLFFNCQLVKVHLVVAFVEVVELFKLVIRILLNPDDLLNVHVCLDHAVWVALLEGEDFFFLGFELAAKLGGFQDLFTEVLVAGECLHTLKRITSQHTNMPLLLIPLLRHILLQLLIMVVDLHLLRIQLTIPLRKLPIILLYLQLPVNLSIPESFNRPSRVGNLRRQLFILL